MPRPRTTFHNVRTLQVGSVHEFLLYGPEASNAYPTVTKMLESARDMFLTESINIIREGRRKYPGLPWWDIDTELKARYDECWEQYSAWRSEAYQVMWQAANRDTDVLWDAWQNRNCIWWPFLPSLTPKEAYENGTDAEPLESVQCPA